MCVKRGAADFLQKPLDEGRVMVTLRGTLRQSQLALENTGLKKQLSDRWELVGESAVRSLGGEKTRAGAEI